MEPTLESFQELLSSSAGIKTLAEQSSRKGVNVLKTIVSALPWIDKASDLIVPGASLLIKNQIICIDDIERAGDGLAVSDILGLVSSLREEKNCKVLLLLNEEGLGDEREAFRTHLEKVVDQAVRYSPTPAESAAAALDQAHPTEKLLADRTIKLGITNIRVINRIRRFLLFVEPIVKPLHPAVLAETVSAMALLGWAVFEPKLAPDLEHIKRHSGFAAYLRKEDPTEDEVRWNTILDAYGFTHYDTYDEILLAGLQSGGFDNARLLDEAKKLAADQDRTDIQKAINHPWQILGSGFGDDEAAFKQALIDSLDANAENMSLHEADNVISTLRELDDDAEADRLIAHYVAKNAGRTRQFFNLEEHGLRQVPDPKLAAAFETKLREMKPERDPKELLLKIERDSSWNPEDIEFLASLSEQDYEDLLRGLSGSELQRVLKATLRFGRIVDGDAAYRTVGEKTIAALKVIGAGSRLNAMRVKSYIPRVPANSEGGDGVASPGEAA
ncbi:hypothetical protein [Sphingobium lactosutens]|uniref:hypothetical protein n=1 Tax=Sphingobium lactosutens TaxID=522773 RepID=UPI0015C1995A|nr:hypothetical protein [Sphingobium lactosutens]